MERIILDVNDQTARDWRNTSPNLRKQIGKNLDLIIADSLTKSKEVNFELILQEIRIEAAKNGLTPDILDQLLNNEE